MAYYFFISRAGTAVIAYVMQDIPAHEGFPYEGASFTNELIRRHRSQGHPPTLHWGYFIQQRYLCFVYFWIGLCHGVFLPLEASLIRARTFVARCFRRSLGLPLVCARGVAIRYSVDAGLLISWFRRRCCWRIVRAFLLVLDWPFRSCKNMWVCGIHEAWHITSSFHVLVQL